MMLRMCRVQRVMFETTRRSRFCAMQAGIMRTFALVAGCRVWHWLCKNHTTHIFAIYS